MDLVIRQLWAALLVTACQRIDLGSGRVTVQAWFFSSSRKVLAASPTRNSMFDDARVSIVG